MKLRIVASLGLALAALCACNNDNTVQGITETPVEAAPTITITDVKKVVSVGAGLNFNAMTGSWSEMAINPLTHAPAVVYYDRSALISPVAGALKFASMDSVGNWNIEVIDANAGTAAQTCGGGATSANCIGAPNVAVPTASQAQMFDVKFLNESTVARPVIAYVYGTGGAASSSSGKSIRLAEKSTSGTWTISTAVLGTQIMALTTSNVGPQLATLEYPIKGLRMLVDDSNRIHLYFGIYASTANNSAYAYTMRKTDGTWTTPVTITAPTAPTTALAFVSGAPTYAAGTGMNQSGAAWCKYTTGGSSADGAGALLSLATVDNTPAASAQGYILRCATANSDGSCATWEGLDFHAGCAGPCIATTPAMTSAAGNAFSRSDLTVDPATGKIFLSAFYSAPTLTAPMAAATGILSTQSPAACDAGLSTTAWATVRGYPTAAQGTLGLRVAADGTNFYLASLVAATGTSLVLNKQTSALSANWNTSPDQITVEATTNTIAGGFLYDDTTSVLWGSYGALTAAAAGATGQDLKVFNAYAGDISTTGTISISHVDQTNFVTQSTAVPMLDAGIAPNGTVGYVYFYQEPGAAPGVNSHLYYGVRGGTLLAPVFGEKIIANATQGLTTFTNGAYPALTYDANSNPLVSYLDNGTAANMGYLMVARSNNGGISFSLERVDGSAVTTNMVGQHSSIKISTENTVGVAYYDHSTGATGQRLKFAKREKNGGWRRYIVDGPGSAGTNGCSTSASTTTGLYSQLKWTSTGRPVIVYQASVAGVKSLRMAYATEAETSSTYTWTCLTLDTVSQGVNTRGEGIDFFLDSADKPYIVHMDQGVGAVRYVTCPSGDDVLTCAQAGASAFEGERLNYVIGSVASIVNKPSVRVDATGKVFVSFYSVADQGLYLATKTAGTSGGWSTTAEALETPVAGATYISGAGQYAVMLLNSSSQPMVFYRSLENWVKYFSREVY